MKEKMKKSLPLLVIILIASFVCFQNYTPGTILSGWDTLHPEFNFGLAIKREIFGVFRSYQGLGAVAAHSDMADLPRIILLYLLSPFIPMSFLRYFYIFLNLILGPIGMYFFLRYVLVILNGVRNPIGIPKQVRDDRTVPSFLGALFYLLNLGAMQQFNVPLEMFTTQYATLPWLFLLATQYIYNKRGQRRSLILFALATLFATPMAYAATLWYVYFIALIVYLGALVLLCHPGVPRSQRRSGTIGSHWHSIPYRPSGSRVQNDTSFKSSLFKKAFILLLLTLLINSFWILPNIYFIFTHGSEVPKAIINKLFSEQAFLYNKEFGNIQDISFLKTFLFDWNVYSGNNNFVQLLSPWIAHLKQPFVQISGFLFAGIAFLGIIYCIFNPFDKTSANSDPESAEGLRVNAEPFGPELRVEGRSRSIKRNKILIALLPLLFLCLFFLFNDNSPTSSLYSFIQDKVPFLKEAYRFPQNKVLGIFTFLFAIYFAAGQLLITRFIASMKHQEGWRDWRASHRVPAGSLRPKDLGCETKERQDPDGTKSQYVQVVIFVVLLLYFMLPAFKGNFISPYMRIKIPSYYFEMFSWFNKEKEDGRIANLPINSLWGWDYHNWYDDKLPSFQGAGFLWFGIKQPLLARDFDRWDPHNEQYYREMSYAIYSQNPEALKLVIEKYNIKYILIDKSIIAPQNNSKVLLHQETQSLLDQQDYLQKVKEFDNTLTVYKVNSKTPNDARLIQNPALIHREPQAFYEDIPYKDYGNYVTVFRHSGNQAKPEHPESPNGKSDSGQARMTDFEKTSSVHYPLANLIDSGGKILPNGLKLSFEGVVIRLPKDSINGLSLPSLLETQESIASSLLVEKNQNQLTISLYPLFPLRDLKDRPIPIVTKVNLPQSKDVILSINKSLSLGTINLNTKKDNTIAIYPATPNEKIVFNLSAIKYSLEPCTNTRDQKTSFGIEKIQSNSFYLFGKNTHLCMTIPLSNIILKDLETSEVLLNVTFNYQSNLPSKFCISKLINASCQKSSGNPLGQNFVLQRDDIQDLGLQFQLDSTNSDSLEKAFYSNLTLSLTYPLHFETLPNDGLKKSLQILSQNPPIGSTIILPYSSDKQFSIDITTLPKTDGICPNTSPSKTSLVKKQILTNNNNRFIRYESFDGVSCDHFSYQNLSQNEAYLVAITSRNVKGLPSTLCITNAVSKHCDVYTRLPANKDFYTDIFLLPPQIKNEYGFDINIGNLGIKNSPSINDLKSIEIIPFPYMWLSQIRTMKQFNNETMNDLLVLPQSFEKGWKAYRINVKCQMSNVKCFVLSSFPFLFGQELKDHVLVNGWANGWIIDSSKFKVQSSKFVVVFLPQYLEYLGFIFLLGTFTYLTAHAIRSKD